jgi:hypothetical protein
VGRDVAIDYAYAFGPEFFEEYPKLLQARKRAAHSRAPLTRQSHSPERRAPHHWALGTLQHSGSFPAAALPTHTNETLLQALCDHNVRKALAESDRCVHCAGGVR